MTGDPVVLAPLDALELAELLDFVADVLSWGEMGRAVHADLEAHLRRWVRRVGPSDPEWNWTRDAAKEVMPSNDHQP